MNDLQSSDPQGFTLMLVSIGLILVCALSLIIVTAVLAIKGKKKRKDSES